MYICVDIYNNRVVVWLLGLYVLATSKVLQDVYRLVTVHMGEFKFKSQTICYLILLLLAIHILVILNAAELTSDKY